MGSLYSRGETLDCYYSCYSCLNLLVEHHNSNPRDSNEGGHELDGFHEWIGSLGVRHVRG